MKATLQRLALPALGFASLLLVWEIAGRIAGPALFAPPSSVAVDYVGLLRQGDMLRELSSSLRQMAVGFIAACVVGMPLGAVMGRSAVADAIFRPWVSMFVVTSTAALIPLFILFLGTGLMLRVTIVFLASVGIDLWTDIIWYQSVGFDSVFWTRIVPVVAVAANP